MRAVDQSPTHRAWIVAGTFILSLALSGCAATTGDRSSAPADLPNEAAGVASDAEACWEFSDTLTLVGNMKIANDEGRLVGSEWDGIVRLALREFARISADPATQVGAAVEALQSRVPDGRVGDFGTAFNLDESVWVEGIEPIKAACTATVPDWRVEGWVGG